MSLSRLWKERGKETEARSLLQKVYSEFTEGFDRQDLKQAKTLLHQLWTIFKSLVPPGLCPPLAMEESLRHIHIVAAGNSEGNNSRHPFRAIRSLSTFVSSPTTAAEKQSSIL